MNIKKHSQYTESSYRYFKSIGWTDEELIERWDAEAAEGKEPCEYAPEIFDIVGYLNQ